MIYGWMYIGDVMIHIVLTNKQYKLFDTFPHGTGNMTWNIMEAVSMLFGL